VTTRARLGAVARELAPRANPGLRVIIGRGSRHQPLAPWLVFSVVAVIAFLGMILTRTSLDRASIELTSIERQLAEATSLNQRLRLEIARLESPARVAPAAQELGMVYPQTSNRLVVEGVLPLTVSDPRWSDLTGIAAQALQGEQESGEP
jgi:cell division protein FtsL